MYKNININATDTIKNYQDFILFYFLPELILS